MSVYIVLKGSIIAMDTGNPPADTHLLPGLLGSNGYGLPES